MFRLIYSSIDVSLKQIAVIESNQSLLKDTRRSTDSPDDASHLEMLELPHVLEDSRRTTSGEDSGSTIPLGDSRSATPLKEAVGAQTPCKCTCSSPVHLEVTRTKLHSKDIARIGGAR